VSGRPAAFLDRDGTLNEFVSDPVSGLPESPLRAPEVRLIDGAAAAARRLARAGFALVCVSNQPAAAKGKVSLEALLAVHDLVLELLREEGVNLDASRLCLHHPEGVVPELAGACDCRKPAPGMLLDAAAELGLDLASSWLFGDTDSDVAAAHAAGARAVLIEHPGSAHKRSANASPELVATNLADGAAQLLHELALASSPAQRSTRAPRS
jgi:D-glycero-D-manno-heptose 1,7-bisphosphate phosphatase